MFRYFLHLLSDWPIAGACNTNLFGPNTDSEYLVTIDATDPNCEVYETELIELSVSDAVIWSNSLATSPDLILI